MNTENKTVITLNAGALEYLLNTLGEDFQVAVTQAALNRASTSYIKEIANNMGLTEQIKRHVEGELSANIGGYKNKGYFRSGLFEFNPDFKKQLDEYSTQQRAQLTNDFIAVINDKFNEQFKLTLEDSKSMIESLTREFIVNLLVQNKSMITDIVKSTVKDAVKQAITDRLSDDLITQLAKGIKND